MRSGSCTGAWSSGIPTRSRAAWGTTMTRSVSSKGSRTASGSAGRGWRWISAASRRPRGPGFPMSPSSHWVIASDARVNFRRHVFLLAIVFSIPAAPAPPARAADARSLVVRPVAPPEAIRAGTRRGEAPRAEALLPAERAVLEARLARQRAFRAFEAELHARAFKIGAGPNPSRRPGWGPPAGHNGPGGHTSECP